MSSIPNPPLAITGLSAINALGSHKDEIIHKLRNGISGLSPSSIPLSFKTFTGMVKHELAPLTAPLAAYDTRMARMIQHLLRDLEPQLQSLRKRWSPRRIAVILGTSTAGAATTEDAFSTYLKTGHLPHDYNYKTQHTFGATLEVVRSLTGAAGPGWVVSTACTSSAKTLGSAARLIQNNIVDAAIVGGVDTLCAMTLNGFWSLSALSEIQCRPFSTESTAINIGEGGALALLERDGAPLAWLEGVGESSDAYHISAPHPEGIGARLAMERAMPHPNLEGVDLINAHGTGTTHNDKMESKAIRALGGENIPVISTKGYTGHTLGGAGATELAFSIWMMQEGFIAPSLGSAPVESSHGVNIHLGTTSAKLRRVLSNSFAFGGNNICLCLRAP